MKTFLFAYFGGMLASIPAYMLFSEVGASPYRDYDLVFRNMGYSLSTVLTYYALIFFAPALGSAIGAKLGAVARNCTTCMDGESEVSLSVQLCLVS